MRNLVKAAAAAGASTLLALAWPAWSDNDQDRARALRSAGDIVSLETILEKARKDHPGRVIETELELKGKRYVYEIEVVDDQGNVRELYYDARTGELLRHEEKRAGDIVPLETIVEKAGKDQPGRVIATELERKGDRYVYEIKVTDSKGGLHKLYYDARSGELIKREEKRRRD